MRDSAIKLIIMGALLPSTWLHADNEHLAVLQVGAETYTNVTVTSVSASGIFFTHSRGLGNAKLRNLGPELRNKFHFDATKAVEIETEEAQANALFLAKISKEPYRTSVRAEPDTTVSVEMADPMVEYKYYDLSQGKPPEISEGMLGKAWPVFKCGTDFTIEPDKGSNGGPFKFRFMTAKLSLELPITITLPTRASAGLREHEEGHRKINEYFYGLGRKAAENAGGRVLGREFSLRGVDLESAQSNVLGIAESVVQAEYWKYTRTPALLANKYYDEVTDHGRNRTNSIQVVHDAIERYELQLPGGGSTR